MKFVGTRTSNELVCLDLDILHQDDSPSNDCPGNMACLHTTAHDRICTTQGLGCEKQLPIANTGSFWKKRQYHVLQPNSRTRCPNYYFKYESGLIYLFKCMLLNLVFISYFLVAIWHLGFQWHNTWTNPSQHPTHIVINLTHWGLVTPYGDRDLGQHWLG